ncbi:DeoR faimly transcriptional regulator [Bacillus sp. LL01]|uniref:helix-turn-helix transcriptional regulator n=1 Tax=Bacillus sp. LL01 TaxID=1665556 RepID=UPI00064D41E0|nr:YafY family protein [Bacillus sp. LL01]KMJ59133.1 DeoR faimly transcriptional regulator [Bacillus sp. LL01]
MPKIDNTLAILWMLRSGEKITAKQIAEKLEMNIRTVYRYIDTLSTSGVPIISDTGHNGGYTLWKPFYEAPLFFDLEEQTSLLHAAVFAEEAGYYGGEALNRSITKLNNYTNQEQETKIAQQFKSLEIINRSNSLSIQPFLKQLELAVVSEYSVKIQYKKRSGDHSNRTIDPYKIIYWNHNWYVGGLCHLRNDIRSFRVDRIETLTLTENQFKQPEDFPTRTYFLNNLFPSPENQARLVLTGSKSSLTNICQHWFFENYLQEKTEGQATFLLEEESMHAYVPTLLLPFGTSIKIMEPVSLKEKMMELLTEWIQFYQQ